MTTVPVNTNPPYQILIGSGLLEQVGSLLRDLCPCQSVMLVCGDIVADLYAPRVRQALEQAGYQVHQFIYPHGEGSKTPETYLSLLRTMAQCGMTRTDAVVALGGGVTGDLAGFAAATYQRGVPYIQIPTTLLAAVDSSVGGKTAIDLPEGKNLVGAFYQPRLVLCDHDTLDTLPPEVFADGCAEVIKYGMIRDADLFRQLHAPIRPQIEEVIARCVTIKSQIVQEDERDTGIRGLLNFGHTVGHAIEKCSHYAVSHGSAVAAGMVLVTRAAYLAGLCGRDCLEGLTALVRQYELPVTTPFSTDALLSAMASDKKRDGDRISLILPEEIGKCRIEKLPVQQMHALLRPALEDQTWI